MPNWRTLLLSNNGNLDASSPQLNGYLFDPVIAFAENNIYTPVGFSNGNFGISPSQLNGYHLDNANQSWPATTYPAAGNAHASVGLPLSFNNGHLGASSFQLDGYHFGNANQAWPAGLSAARPVTTCLVTESVYTPAGLPVPANEDFSTSLPYLDSSVGYDTIAESDFDGSAARHSATYGHQINPPNSSFEYDAENWLAHEAIGSASVPIQNPSLIDGRAQPPLDIPTNAQNGTADTMLPSPSRYTCEYGCQGKGGTFKRRSDRTRHYKSHHLPHTTLFCGIPSCNYSSNRSDKLDEHRRRRHAELGYRPRRS
ncbi:MAG: hypothetical protein M1840_001804 [Geoglossum simile]|nr:MAG: hypothetical protein M1840_001804 [Geoglossum simile]